MMNNPNVDLRSFIVDVPDFPKPGILFRDIGRLLASPAALREVRKQFLDRVADEKPDYLAALDARGFTFAGLLSDGLNAGILMVRKKGKLPGAVLSQDYGLEYRDSDTLEMQKGIIQPGQRVLVIDDVLATGGTAKAAVDLVRQAGGEVTSIAVVIELLALKGRENINSPDAVAGRGGQIITVHSLLPY